MDSEVIPMGTADLSLTKQEENLMNFLWDYGQPATSHDVMEKCSNITWSVNYIHVMFRSLLKKGAIECCGMVQYGSQYARQFRCVVTREEYFSQQAKKNGMNVKSLLRTAAAMAAQVDEKEQAELVEELEEIIAQLKEKKP